MTKHVRVNVRTAINSASIRRERRNGRDVIIVPSATMPDNIVMNKVRYPADAIAKSFGSLENTPAPLGHPNIEGAFVSASDPEGMVRGFIGAWNKNVRRENGRVFLDKVIDVAFASQTDGGKSVINAIEKGEPIHTSTGLFATLTGVTNADDGAEWEADDIVFDHDAILLGEEGAATPDKGVGIFVNSAGTAERVEVINSQLEDEADRELEWAAEYALRSVERMERVPLLERIKEAIKSAVTSVPAVERESFSVNEEQFNALDAKVNTLAETLSGLDDKIATAIGNAVKPLTDQIAATADAQKVDLINKVVEAGLLDEETAKVADVAVLNALAAKIKPLAAMRVNGAFTPSTQDDKGGYALHAAE